jgi:hypothetical protein
VTTTITCRQIISCSLSSLSFHFSLIKILTFCRDTQTQVCTWLTWRRHKLVGAWDPPWESGFYTSVAGLRLFIFDKSLSGSHANGLSDPWLQKGIGQVYSSPWILNFLYSHGLVTWPHLSLDVDNTFQPGSNKSMLTIFEISYKRMVVMIRYHISCKLKPH